MFDIGMAEMAVIGVVALIVVGPKDLPQMFRNVGNFVGKAKGMARDFQRAMDQAADQSGVGDLTADIKNMASAKNLGLDDATSSFQNYQKNFDPEKVSAAAAEAKAKRESAVLAANKAAESWPPEGVDIPVVENSEVVEESVEAQPAPAKKAAPKKAAATKKPAAKKPATKTAAKKPTAPKTAAAKKPAAKKAPPAKTAAKKTTKAAETKA